MHLTKRLTLAGQSTRSSQDQRTPVRDHLKTGSKEPNSGDSQEVKRYHDVVINAYFDDSADANMQEYAVCGGIFGDPFLLSVVENLWYSRTMKLERPFRSTECECQKGQFKNWNKTLCNELIADLVSILANSTLQTQFISTSVPIKIYREIFPNSHRNDPYRLALRHVLIGISRVACKRKDIVKCFFEAGANNGDISKAHQDVSEYHFPNTPRLRGRLVSFRFGDKTSSLLQAADLVAREGFKVSQNMGVRPIRKPLLCLWDQSGMVIWSRDYLLKLRDLGHPLSMESLGKLPDEAFMMESIATPFSETKYPI
jgi:hypothetical protein